MPERQYTYRVEIDASSAQEAARQARAIFQKELGEILTQAQPAQQAQATSTQQALQRTTTAAAETKRTLEQTTKLDLTAPIDELISRLEEARRLHRITMDEWEKQTTKAAALERQGDARSRALKQDAYRAIGNQAGAEAEAAVRRMGSVPIGALNAEFPDDESATYTEREHYSEDDTVKRRFLQEEKQKLLETERAAYQYQLEGIQIEQAIAKKRLEQYNQEIERLSDLGLASDDDTEIANAINRVLGEIDQTERSIAELADQEADLLQNVQNATQRATDYAEARAAKAARDADVGAGNIHVKAPAGADAPGTVYTQQTALTVSARSVENAKELAEAMQAVAGQAERYNAALSNAARRDYELENIKARANYEQAARVKAEDEIETRRTDAAAARAEIQKTVDANKAAQAQQTATVQASGRQRIELAKGEARAMAEAAKGDTIARGEAEKRLTEITKQELRERERATKAAYKEQQQAARQATSRPTAGQAGAGQAGAGLPFGMTWTGLAYGAAGALGIYGADQIARGTFEAGREGAQQLRQMETFEAMAQRMGVSSNVIIKAIREASRETITNTSAMGLAAQVLSQKFAATSDDLSGDIETLVRFSRRASQIYTDESGAFLNTQEVFARLIKFAREGNKELVDQFGLSNKAIADSLGISVDGLASVTGASDRWRGMIQLLGEEMGRLGEATVGVADQFEADTARIDEAWNRIKRGLAEPVSAVVTAAADFVDSAAIKTGTGDTDTIRRFIEESNQSWRDIGKQPIAGFEELLKTFDQLDAASAKNTQAAEYYRAELNKLGQEMINANGASAEQIARLDELQRVLGLITAGQDAYSIATGAASQKMIQQSAELTNLAIGLGTYQNLYTEGIITLSEYTAITDLLAGSMRNLAAAAGGAAAGIAGVNAAVSNGRGGEFFPNAIAGPGMAAGPAAFALQQEQDKFTQDRIDAQTERDAKAREERKKADEAAAKKAASEWESAAKKAQAAFEAAAEKTANEFKASLEKVPGLFGTSEVTAEDMEAAKLGIYQPKADERLRVLADEVLNKKDTPEDPAEWAKRLGLDPGTDPKIVLAKARQAWADSSLFAGGANLDLINAAAVESQKATDAASASGRQALLKYFGLDSETGLQDEAGRTAFAEMIGLSDDKATEAGTAARAAFDAGFYAPNADATKAGTDSETGAGMAATLAKQLETDVTAGEVAEALYSVGESILGRIHAGYEAAAAQANWSDALIASLAADVAPIVLESITDQLPPR